MVNLEQQGLFFRREKCTKVYLSTSCGMCFFVVVVVVVLCVCVVVVLGGNRFTSKHILESDV